MGYNNRQIQAVFLIALFFALILTSCSKKGDSEYFPISNNCWDITDWKGLKADSLLSIDTVLNIPAANQVYVDWLAKPNNHVLFRSLTSENFEDLKCMDQYFSKCRIVQLGESNHGTKEYNLAKIRLIKYLHEVHGFNVIAFESGFFDCTYANLNAQSMSIENFMKNSIFSVWHTEELVDLFYYIKYKTDYKLNLAGFDCQDLYPNNNSHNRAVLLKEFASYIDPVIAENIYLNDIEVTHNIYNQIELLANRDLYKAKVDSAINFFEHNYSAILDSMNGDKKLLQIAMQSLQGTAAHIDKRYFYYLNNHQQSYEVRDSSMAANINFLSEVMYPNEKIIVWAHNGHIAYNQDNYTSYIGYNRKIMGNWLYDYYQNDIYTIGLYSLYGECSWAGETFPFVMPTTDKSLEGICYKMNKKHVFFDIKNHPPEPGNFWFEDIITGRLGWDGFESLFLRKEYDGILFIDRSTIPDYTY